jgi:predicted RNase H-like nuclease (RuvC/YqgF family)
MHLAPQTHHARSTIQSIEYALRSLERMAEREREKLDHLESDLATYRCEIDKPFEHKARLRGLELKQAELNVALDLFKSGPRVRRSKMAM